jgi:glyoxylase-like metal-dependent hydrolase (beta-lactamase superfamily II)
MLSWRIGEVTIKRIVEMNLPVPTGGFFLPQSTPELLRESAWLYPHFVNEKDEMLLSIHALLVEAPGLRLVVDTCIGNDRPRSIVGGAPLATPFLSDLADAGWSRDSVDAVVCTHLHVDHVGWNTMLENGRWVPTFPKARYFLGREEFDHWSAVKEGEQPQIMADSVQPIFDAGLAQLVEMDHVISPEVRLIPSPGHTPGHVCVEIKSQGERAVITGDCTHHPCQLAHPDWSPMFDSDGAQAAKTRTRLFAEWADEGALVIGTHYAAPTAGRLVRDGEAFRFEA